MFAPTRIGTMSHIPWERRHPCRRLESSGMLAGKDAGAPRTGSGKGCSWYAMAVRRAARLSPERASRQSNRGHRIQRIKLGILPVVASLPAEVLPDRDRGARESAQAPDVKSLDPHCRLIGLGSAAGSRGSDLAWPWQAVMSATTWRSSEPRLWGHRSWAAATCLLVGPGVVRDLGHYGVADLVVGFAPT